MLPVNIMRSMSQNAFSAHFWSEHCITQFKYVFCAEFVDFVSIDVTVVYSFLHLKGLKSRFLLFLYTLKNFKMRK